MQYYKQLMAFFVLKWMFCCLNKIFKCANMISSIVNE